MPKQYSVKIRLRGMGRAAMIHPTMNRKAINMNSLIQSEIDEAARTGWLKRLGAAGFAFFFLKGLLWLIVPSFLYVVR
jgi:hypothetical protein